MNKYAQYEPVFELLTFSFYDYIGHNFTKSNLIEYIKIWP